MMPRRLSILLIGAAALTLPAAPARADMFLPGSIGVKGPYDVPVQSLQQRRFYSVVHQQRDFSCGAAALATLLRYHMDIPVSEADIFAGMWAHGDQVRIRKVGFSLLEMKRYLATRGLSSDGYAVDLDKIEHAHLPGIALLTIEGYKHFVVVKGVQGDRVLIGDPALGLRAISRKQFMRQWNGVYFVISADSSAPQRFDVPAHWRATPQGSARTLPRLDDSWSQRIFMRAPGEF